MIKQFSSRRDKKQLNILATIDVSITSLMVNLPLPDLEYFLAHISSRLFFPTEQTRVHYSFWKRHTYILRQCACVNSIPAWKSQFPLPGQWKWKDRVMSTRLLLSKTHFRQDVREVVFCGASEECQESHWQEKVTQQGWQLHHKAPQPVVNHSAWLPSTVAP